MARRMILAALVMATLVGSAGSGKAEVRVNIGINLVAPPQLVAVPSSPVLYAPAVTANYFSYAGRYYVFTRGAWYVGPGHNGPWAVLAREYVPRPILAVPVQYYRVPPPGWKHWRREGPPRWAPAWGRRWEERREGRGQERREEGREERRDDRPGGRPEEHGKGRR